MNIRIASEEAKRVLDSKGPPSQMYGCMDGRKFSRSLENIIGFEGAPSNHYLITGLNCRAKESLTITVLNVF